ncbi:AAR123Cp [Eremothecium gossypii ATCC 10895]|uniref:AAR123Cp n=1 Tax=Eremothecium gossypii (strain ATCC 10895 / CBS 109.51 / FGSC 9923 / NRRL Y-1056) TaxID=284811 RepID=Q75EF8_EREGS|nr:AAR123Cp [Eremothecium gossypii ATCC 10895]AAS50489.1 AAR123Cp [Eremothecium gossypii ATCC 10895]AEY94776.1 FAAR123Cp [Eremothecium gossypii FDAG1]
MGFVEEINLKTYDPDVYFTSIHARTSSARNRIPKSLSTGSETNRPNRRVNYSLADLENRIYNQRGSSQGADDTDKADSYSAERYTQAELLKSNKRFMELDTENFGDARDVPYLMSALTGINKDRIDQAATGISGGAVPTQSSSNRARNKFELPKNMQMMYRCTRPPIPKRKNTNRIVALKKTLSSRRPLSSYLDALDHVNRSIIYNNVYNKKFTKVLPVVTVCSICGGYRSLSSCVKCMDKICSLKCYTLHNETRCSS